MKKVKVKILMDLDERKDKREIKIEGDRNSILFAFCDFMTVLVEQKIISSKHLKGLANDILNYIDKGEK